MKGLHTKWAGREYYYFEVTGSTNDDCSRFLKEGASHGMVVVADSQTQGRGRRGRNWESPADESVYMSIGLRPKISPDRASMLTLVMALAVSHAIEEVSGLETALIKWPNDIVIGGRKVCGILTEMHLDGNAIEDVVVGVGINLGKKEFSKELLQTATSLTAECDCEIKKEALVAGVLEHFETYYEKFVEKCDMSTIMGEYVGKLVNKDKDVRVLDPQGEYTGTARGINELGELLVEKEDGTTVAVYAGEVSVRGIYGYV